MINDKLAISLDPSYVNAGCPSTPSQNRSNIEQMEVEEPPWAKEQQRRMRKRRRLKIVMISAVVAVLLMIMGVGGLVIKYHIIDKMGGQNVNITNQSKFCFYCTCGYIG